jgi:hypothetical protein
MAANNSGGLLPGGPWNTSPFLGSDAPYELSPQHFSELASELQAVETRQRQRQDSGLNINNYSLNLSTTAPPAVAPSRHLPMPIPPPPPEPQQLQQQQGGGLDPGQNQAAGHISRLYKHMLLQLPIEVQQRAQHHLLLRTANVSKSGVPVQQATMLVQQELLPLMQQAFMRLHHAGAIADHGATVTTNPVTIGTRVGVALPPQQQQQQQQRDRSGASHHVAGGRLSASAIESIAKGKAVAAPAIAATEAVIETHRRSNRQQHVVQQQQQQQQPAAASEHQMQRIRQLQAMQALHMHSTTTTTQQQEQQQQQQQQHERKSSAAAAAALATAVPSYTSNPHQQQKPYMDGSAHAIRQEIIAGLANNQPTIAIAPSPSIINIHTTNSNSQKRSNGMNWGDIDTGLATSAGAYLHQQQKKQRGVGATPTAAGGGNHGQLLDQWSDLFGASAASGNNNNNNVASGNGLLPRGLDAALNGKNISGGVGDVNGGGTHYFLPSLDILNSMPLPTNTNTTNTNRNINKGSSVDNAVGVAALSRGKVASAKIQAKEATQRYSWTAGMLNEIFIPTPVDKTGLLKQEQQSSTNMPPPPPPLLPLPSMSMSPRAKGAAYGTEGQRMLADAAQRVHQGVGLPNTFTFPTTTTAAASVDHGNGNSSSAPNTAAMNGGMNHTRDTIADVDVRIVPVSMTVTQLQVAPTTTTTATTAQGSQVNPSLVTEAELCGFDDGPPLQLGDFLSTE